MNEQKAVSTPTASPAPMGLEHPGVIDFMQYNATRGEVLVVMVEKRPWDQPELQLFQLQEKLNAYLSFVLDGEMVEAYPQFAHKPVRIRLECAGEPGPEYIGFLQIVRDQLALQDIGFEVAVVSGAASCACGQPEGGCGAAS